MIQLTKIITIIFILTFCSLKAQESSEYLSITASKNDKDIIVTNSINYNHFYSKYVDLETNLNHDIELENNLIEDLVSVRINGNSNLVAYIYNSKTIIYNYKTQLKVSEINEPLKSNNFYNVEFSNDGILLYALDIFNGVLKTYNTASGNLDNSYIVESEIKGSFLSQINTITNEFIVKVDSVLHIISIDSKSEIRTIPIDLAANRLEFLEDGTKIHFLKGNQLVIINYLDGSVEFNKEFQRLRSITFTNDSKHLIIDSDVNNFVYSLEKDTVIDLDFMPDNSGIIAYSYLTSNLDKALIIYKDALYCPDYGIEMPIEFDSPYLIDLKNKIEISSFPEGKIYPYKFPIISNDNSFVLASGYSINHKKNHLLYSIDKKYIKRIYTDLEPILYFDKSNIIAFWDSTKIKLFNIETNQFDREFETGMDTVLASYYLPKDGGIIVLRDTKEIRLFSYSNLSIINRIELSNLQLSNNFFKFNRDDKLITFRNGRVVKLNIFTSEVEESQSVDIPAGFYIRDLTSDGKFLLFMNNDYDVIHYNLENQSSIVTSIKSNLLGEHSTFLSIGFSGNYQTFWYSFIPNPIYRRPLSFEYDVIKDTILQSGAIQRKFNQDNSYYTTFGGCGYGFGVSKVRDLLSSVETTTTGITGSVYPNPASDFIQLEYDMNIGISDVQIYNSFGTKVMNIEAVNISDRIDISSLTAGVYFVKTPSHSYKFIKL